MADKKKDKEEDIRPVIELIRNSSIIQECTEVASEYCDKARHKLKLLPDNASRQALMNLADFIIARRK